MIHSISFWPPQLSGIWLVAALLILLGRPTVTKTKCDYEQINAALILQFVRYTEWSKNGDKSRVDPLVIGVMGAEKVAESLRQLVGIERSTVARTEIKREIRFIEISADDTNMCDTLYFGVIGAGVEEFLCRFRSTVLKVREEQVFTEQVGVIGYEQQCRRTGSSAQAVSRVGLTVDPVVIQPAIKPQSREAG